MIKSFFKIAWRNIKGSPLFSSINILGLTLSLAIATLLFLFIHHENSFNTSYTQKEQIYRVITEATEYDDKPYATVAAMVAPTSITDIPEVLDAVRFYKHGFGEPAYISTDTSEFIESSLFYADPSLFKIFDLKLSKGLVDEALNRPNTAIISESTAQRYFGTDQVVGKILKVDSRTEIEITGVFEDLPSNVSLDGNIYVSFATSFYSKRPTWSNVSLETYLLTTKDAKQDDLKEKLVNMLHKNVEEESRWYTLNLQPLRDVHLYSSHLDNAYSSRIGSIEQVKSLTWLALLILIIACINYMNLTTARSQKRAKEVGVSKTLGATTKNLIARFYAETGLITAISIILGVILALIFLPMFNQISGKEIPITMLTSTVFIMSIIGIWLVSTLLAGSYPAIYMSSLSAKKILSGGKVGSLWATNIRKGLVVMQFIASTVLIVGVFVIYNQLKFIQDKDLGFDKEQVMAISISGVREANTVDLLTQKLVALSTVSEVGAAQGYPGKSVSGRSVYNPLNTEASLAVQTNRADAKALDVVGLKFIAGKNLPVIKSKTDTLVEVVVNKRVIEFLGFTPEEAIGKKISMLPRDKGHIVGVVDDFGNSRPFIKSDLYLPYTHIPSDILNNPDVLGSFEAVFTLEKSSRIKGVKAEVKRIIGGIPLPADQEFNTLEIAPLTLSEAYSKSLIYNEDASKSQWYMILILSGLLGLFIFLPTINLININVTRILERSSEIGVRKAFGANRTNLVGQFVFENVILTLIGGIIGLILALILLNIINSSEVLGDGKLLFQGSTFVYSFLITMLFGIVSGLIPAWRMSKIHIVNALKENVS